MASRENLAAKVNDTSRLTTAVEDAPLLSGDTTLPLSVAAVIKRIEASTAADGTEDANVLVAALHYLRQRVFRAPFERALRYPRRRWFVGSSCATLLTASVVLFLLAYLIGHGRIEGHGGFVATLSDAAQNAGVAIAVAVPMAVLGAWTLRRLSFEYLAWRPGLIHVPDFDESAKPTGVTASQLTAHFRTRLSTLRLQSGSPAPGAPPPSDFLGVLGETGELSNVGSVFRLLRAAFPAAAWEVRGTLVRRDHDSSPYGVSVQVTRLPDQGSVLHDTWHSTWEGAVNRAADQAIAAVLPRTRLCRGPWTSWRGYVMPPSIVGAYEDSLRMASEGRYDAALDACYRALEDDPLNRELRLQLGKLQEQLGLFLDALVTYDGILSAVRPAGYFLPNGLYRRAARRERRRVGHVVRYRRLILLGGRKTVEQWMQLEHRSTDAKLQQTRARVALLRLGPASIDCDDSSLATLSDVERDELLRARESLMKRDLVKQACTEARRLQWTLRWWRMLHPRDTHLLPTTVAVAWECAKERDRTLSGHWRKDDAPSFELRLRTMARSLKRSALIKGLRTYQSHYNAACMYAIPLTEEGESLSESGRARLAKRAIRHLELATSFADSAFLARRQSWLTRGDPDLDGLRERQEFAQLIATYFPGSTTPREQRERTRELADARYFSAIVCEVARGWSDVWSARARRAFMEADHPTVQGWWRDERDAWTFVMRLGRHEADHAMRLELVRARQRWSQTYGCEFADPKLDLERAGTLVEAQASDEDTGAEVLRLRRRLELLVDALQDPRTPDALPPWDAGRRSGRLLAGRAKWRVRAPHLKGACQHRATLWREVFSLLEADGDAGQDFRKQVDRALTGLVKHEPWLSGATETGLH